MGISKMTCEGPFIWFSVGLPEDAAILECARCAHFIVTGNFNNDEHYNTPILRQGV